MDWAKYSNLPNNSAANLIIFWEKNTYITLLGPTRLSIFEIFPSKPDFQLYKWEKILPTPPKTILDDLRKIYVVSLPKAKKKILREKLLQKFICTSGTSLENFKRSKLFKIYSAYSSSGMKCKLRDFFLNSILRNFIF